MLEPLASRADKKKVDAAFDDEAVIPPVPYDRAGFADLYRQHVTGIYRYLFIRTGNEQDAQDLTAQTFLRAFEGLASYRGDGQFVAWLMGIARRKVADYYRKQPPHPTLDDLSLIPHPDPLPEELVEHQLQLERVAATLRVLAPDRAEAVAMYVFGNLTYDEIGHVMNWSADAAKMLVHRGLRDLRERLLATDWKE
jgi:RNA polymerase sigma-70 factor (ECF subfamily)